MGAGCGVAESPKRKAWILIVLVSGLSVSLVTSNGLWYQAVTLDHEKYRGLLSDYQISEAFRPNSTVIEYYEGFKGYYAVEVGSNWSSELAAWYDVTFFADLARHDIGISQWQSLEDSYTEITGTRSFNDARTKLNLFLNLSGLDSRDGPAQKIEKILAGINTWVHYARDIYQRCNSPWETIWLRSGDCEDFSMLAASLFRLSGIESAITLLWNGSIGNHAAVLVHLDDLGIYDFSSYDNLTQLGLSEGRWIFIEPQDRIDIQFDYPGKMQKWTLTAADEV